MFPFPLIWYSKCKTTQLANILSGLDNEMAPRTSQARPPDPRLSPLCPGDDSPVPRRPLLSAFSPAWRAWPHTPVLLSGKSHRQRSLLGYSPWGCRELDTTKRLGHHHRRTVSNTLDLGFPPSRISRNLSILRVSVVGSLLSPSSIP